MRERTSILNQRFGTWLVINTALNRNNVKYYLCKCDCGIEREVAKGDLTRGKNKNCGCLRTKNLIGQTVGNWTVLNKVNVMGAVKYNCKCICGIEKEVYAASLINKTSLSCGCVNTIENLVGQTFTNLTVISLTDNMYNCVCKCGNTTTVRPSSLINNKTRSCGCLKSLDLTGKTFNLLTVILQASSSARGVKRWNCLCKCGNTSIVTTSALNNSSVKSCGCINKGNTTHGFSSMPEHQIYRGMKARCLNSNSPAYIYYGGRGIKICDRWLESFENFLDDMGSKPTKTSSIERINVDGNYEPANCKWLEKKLQARNNRLNVLTTEIVQEARSMKHRGLKISIIFSQLKQIYPQITYTALSSALNNESWQ